MYIRVAGTSNQLLLSGSKTGKKIPKNKAVTDKTPLFVTGSFCSCHSVCLNIGFRLSSFEWKCVFNLSGFN